VRVTGHTPASRRAAALALPLLDLMTKMIALALFDNI
jgi:hypothetical protein